MHQLHTLTTSIEIQNFDSTWKAPPTFSEKFSQKQECIPVGCVPSAAVAVALGVSALGGLSAFGWGGGVCSWEGCLLLRGVCSLGGVCCWGVSVLGGCLHFRVSVLGGCLLLGGVYSGGVCSGGCLLLGGVSALGGVCLLLGGVCSGGVCSWGHLLLGGICSGGCPLPRGGECGIPACTEADTPTHPVDRQMPVKT